MASTSLADQLDDAIENMFADPEAAAKLIPLQLGELLGIAAEFRLLPDPEFRAALKHELVQEKRPAVIGVANLHKVRASKEEILPTLFGESLGNYPVHRTSFALSLAMHAALIVVVVITGTWMAKLSPAAIAARVTPIDISPYLLPSSANRNQGGGGGGDRDKLAATKGRLPRFSQDQLTPPAIIVRNQQPSLTAEPTVVGPPALSVPSTAAIGDPLSAVLQASNGIGSGGGIGSGSGGGIGSGRGPGVGPGEGGGIGGGVFRVGGGVSAPRAIYAPDPEYSDEARRAKYQGAVVLWVIVGADGRPRDIRVSQSLGMGLDEKAIEAVRQWKFEPSTMDGRPVAVQVNVEVDFRLY